MKVTIEDIGSTPPCKIDGCERKISQKGYCAKCLHAMPLSKRLPLYFDEKESGCWEWNGFKRRGYGGVTINNKFAIAHRISYELYVGEIPEGMLVRHRCDNRACVNPKHLEVGHHADNMQDMVERMRSCSGEKFWSAKIKDEDRIVICELVRRGHHQDDIAKIYDVRQSTVSSIWKKYGKSNLPLELDRQQIMAILTGNIHHAVNAQGERVEIAITDEATS